MRSALVAHVAIDRTAYHFDKPYDYLVPFDMIEGAKVGCRVLVPFGTGNRKRQGMILSVDETTDFDKLKPINSVLDDEPLLSKEMIKLASWIKERTFSTYFDVFHLMIPAGINMHMVSAYHLCEIDDEVEESLSDDEKLVVKCLRQSGARVEKKRLLDILGLGDDSNLLDKMVEKGIISRFDDAVRRMGDATVKMVRLVDGFDESLKLTKKQSDVVELLKICGAASVKEICYFTGVTNAVITSLAKKEIIEYFEEEVYRNFLDTNRNEDLSEIVLTDEQTSAFDRLTEIYHSGKGGAALLYGVTGSGKTKVFLRLVDEVIASGRQVIVMVPEISLTPQTLSLFHNRYGGRVAVFHSAMSMGQRMDEWKRVKRGEATVAIGTRSAVFAPFDNLGLVIIDEEQEHTYKSESSPRFHARDVARFRCAENKALLLLASATPSLETYTAAINGRYELCKLTKRYGNATLPEVKTVDMNEEIQSGNKSMLSRALIEQLQENMDAGKQSILLLNRRGHNTFVSCGGCGEVVSCPNCSISLTYHSANNRLMCHYCGYSKPFAEKCENCGNEHVRYSGAGTQRIEQDLLMYLPEARILRVDADSTMQRSSFERMLTDFGNGKYDIMLGTQMVAKGLDFSNVTLVGVLGADGLLYSDDYRCYERAFSLLTQVVGRSGRGNEKGTALVQTVTPENSVINLAALQNYEKFYEQEILTRKIMIYPPYCELCVVGFVGEDKDSVKASAYSFFEKIKTLNEYKYPSVKMIILGPSAASIPRVNGKYRYRIIIKTKNTADFRRVISTTLIEFGKDRRNAKVTVYADMNPDSIM